MNHLCPRHRTNYRNGDPQIIELKTFGQSTIGVIKMVSILEDILPNLPIGIKKFRSKMISLG
jgi:hypothetical protein